MNSKSCQVEIADQSMWVRQYNVFSQADARQKPQVEKQVTVIQQFKIRRDGSKIWRRSSTISDLKGISQTMMIGGKILNVDREKLSLSIERSTCEGVNSGRDPVSQLFGAIIGTVLDATVGTLMRGMVDGMGKLMANMLTIGQIGCYAVRGPGVDEFVASANQTVDF